MPILIAHEAHPGETTPLAASVEPLQEQDMHRSFKAVQRPTIIGDPKVIEMSA